MTEIHLGAGPKITGPHYGNCRGTTVSCAPTLCGLPSPVRLLFPEQESPDDVITVVVRKKEMPENDKLKP